MLQQAYGEDCLSRTQCHKWYQRFKSGRTSIEDDPKSGRPSTSMDDDHVEKVLAVIRQHRRLTVREVAEEVGICKSSCHLILTEKLKMRRVASKFVPRLLTRHSLSMNFWRNMRRLLSPSRPTLQIWPLPTFFLFPKWKSSLKGRWFQTVEEIEENSIRDLRGVPQNTF